MTKKSQSANHNPQKSKKGESSASGKMRVFYILVLLIMIFSLFARVSGARRSSTRQVSSGTAARVLVFHHKDESFAKT
jgi:hypothetical protein